MRKRESTLTLRLPSETKDRLERLATRHDLSLSCVTLNCIEKGLLQFPENYTKMISENGKP